MDIAELGIKVKFDDVGRATVELDKMATAGAKAEAATGNLGTKSKDAAGHVSALGAAQEMAAKHTGAHTLGLSRIERVMAGAIEQAIGLNRVMGVVGTTMLQFGLGSVETIGILAGLGAVTLVWYKLTEAIRAAAKAQDEAVVKLNAAVLGHVRGAGGELSDMITAGYGRLSDIGEEKKSKGSWGGAFKTGDFLSYNLNPADRAEQLKNLDKEAALLKLAIKSAETDLQIANARQYAASVSTPYDRAISRGTSIDGFYSQALAAETKLTQLAKSGTFEVRDAAIQALGAMDKIIAHHKLISLGLASGPSQLFGVEAGAVVGGMKSTEGDLSTALRLQSQHGVGSIEDFRDKIIALADTVDYAAKHSSGQPLSVRNDIQEVVDNIDHLRDALALAASSDREGVAAGIRNSPRSNGFLANALAQDKYGQQMADRIAALKLPAVFDAVKEAAVRLGEGLRHAKGEVGVGLENWKPGNIGAGIREGATQGVANLLGQFSPANITMGLVTGAVSSALGFIQQGFMDLAGSILNGGQAAREAKLQFDAMQDSLDAAIASFQHNDLAAAIAGIAGQQDALIKQAWDTYGTASYIILHGTKDLTDALAKIGKGATISAEQLKQQQQYQLEDLRVRNLRATGRGDEADLLAFKEKQAREYAAALLTHPTDTASKEQNLADMIYLNTLQTTQNNELLAYQNGLLSTALRNAPTGFWGIGAYQSDYVTPRGPSYATDPTVSTNSNLPNGRSGAGGTTTVILQVDGKVLTRTVINNVDQFAATTGGAGSSRSAAFDRMPS
jgi:hypothetical protein